MAWDRLLRIGAICAGAFLVAATVRPARAQSLDSLRRRYALPGMGPSVMGTAANVSRSAPGNTSGSPTAFGANMGDVFVGASYQNKVRGADVEDGAVVAGFGLGNARDAVGLEVAFTSFSTVRSGFGKTGGVSVKLHRTLPSDFAIAAGFENATDWGPQDGGQSWYGVISKVQTLTSDPTGFFGSFVLNAGVGDGRFRDFHLMTLSTGAIVMSMPQSDIGYFGSVGLRLHQTTSIIADWGGQDLSVGLSIAPFSQFPLVFTPAMADVTERANATARFVLGVGLAYHLP